MRLNHLTVIGLLSVFSIAAKAQNIEVVRRKVCRTNILGSSATPGVKTNYVKVTLASETGSCTQSMTSANFFGPGTNISGLDPALIFSDEKLQGFMEMFENSRLAGRFCEVTKVSYPSIPNQAYSAVCE